MRLLMLTLSFLILTLWWAEAKPFRNPMRLYIKHERTVGGVKGGHVGTTKGLQIPIEIPRPRKGEYNCGPRGEKLCKLPTGVEPKNCDGVCQYPV